MIRDFKISDYEMLAQWWQVHNWPILPLEALPGIGFISMINDKPILAGFLYFDKTAPMISWLEWVTSNPESEFEERSQAWEELMLAVDDKATSVGTKMIFTVSDNVNYINRMEKFDYTISGTSCTQMMKFLKS